MARTVRRILMVVAGGAWLLTFAAGFARLWEYEGAAGRAASAPIDWPAQTTLTRDPHVPTLLVLMHPKCPCSRASVEELARLMARCQGKLLATVLMIRPNGAPQGWEQTDLWQSAARIPGVVVIADEQGAEARRFGAVTSGQTLLYSPGGRLLFSGGITASRGHSGDNAGEAMIAALALDERRLSDGERTQTPVYGCPLFNDTTDCQKNGTAICPK